jgi:hypothetical protein
MKPQLRTEIMMTHWWVWSKTDHHLRIIRLIFGYFNSISYTIWNSCEWLIWKYVEWSEEIYCNAQDVHFARLLDVQNILSADADISRQTKGHSFGDHLSSVTLPSVIESFYFALFCVFMTRVSQCPISLRAEHSI